MTRLSPGDRAPTSVRRLFVVQVLVGVIVGIGTVVLGTLLLSAGNLTPAVAAFLLGWIAVGVMALWWLERRKPLELPLASTTDWARDVRELRSSRLEIVNAFEIERRRIERDLHDGAQQHIVASSMKVGEARLLLDSRPEVPRQVTDLLAEAQDASDRALAALRATVAGIHPQILSDRGLEAAVRDLAQRSPVQAEVRVPHPLPPIPEAVAAAAYFLVSEALTNVAKHAPRAQTTVLLSADERLHVAIVDDGLGGARIERGRGLAGMAERLAAFGGALTVASPAGGPTSLTARIPLLLAQGQSGVDVAPPDRMT